MVLMYRRSNRNTVVYILVRRSCYGIKLCTTGRVAGCLYASSQATYVKSGILTYIRRMG